MNNNFEFSFTFNDKKYLQILTYLDTFPLARLV